MHVDLGKRNTSKLNVSMEYKSPPPPQKKMLKSGPSKLVALYTT